MKNIATVTDCWAFDKDITERAVEVRHRIHSDPELSHDEFRTQALLSKVFESVGIENVKPAFGTGLIVDIHGANSANRHVIGFRGDMDALPIQENRPDLTYASTNGGIMHACGHDTHTVIALAIALQLHRRRDQFSGTARFWFQPAEEAEPLGGRGFLNEGWIDSVDAAIGVHVNPAIDSGKIGVLPGAVNCSSDEWQISIKGKDSHAGMPHQGIDSITIGASLIQELNHLVARHRDPNVPMVITVGSIHGGTAKNVVCGDLDLSGTIRTMDEDYRELAHERMRSIAAAFSQIYGARIKVDIVKGEPITRNAPEMVNLIKEAARVTIGTANIADCDRWTASDDFGFYTEKVPGVYYWYGSRNPELGNEFNLHHPKFGVTDEDMLVGAWVGLEAMRRFLKTGIRDYSK